MYEYKVIDGQIITNRMSNFAGTLEQMLNEMSVSGWEFYCQSNITEYVPPGCLGLVSAQIKNRQTFIFRRKVEDTDLNTFKNTYAEAIQKKEKDILANPK